MKNAPMPWRSDKLHSFDPMNNTAKIPTTSASFRRGKIASLPAAIRLQINLRLDDGHQADQILPWLNDLPEVQQIIRDRFDAVPVSPQNLSAWRQGGFQEWLIHRQLFDTAAHLHEQLEDYQILFNCLNHDQAALKLADLMITQMTLRLNAFLGQWTGNAPDPQTTAVLKIGHFILRLQQAAYRGQKQAAELPAIRYRVKHEVQTDLRNEIFRDMVLEKAQARQAADQAAKARKKEKSKKPTTQLTPKLPATAPQSNPIKPNQTSTNAPSSVPCIPSFPSLPSVPSTPSTTAPPNPTAARKPTPTEASTPSIQSTSSTSSTQSTSSIQSTPSIQSTQSIQSTSSIQSTQSTNSKPTP
jgi:hypothetical protein